ncbi:AbrB/MazE/SpoVT family DNA-binding domain-containing protein [Paenibacillus caui]|uniref:AbrB/MazE/SpoVT family DNA-binding domain-containing protein n=1 Tax=Paenibacillus caui TaxID=2873927 RepID=UPI001CA8D6D2|nr:AbrB/MazE/SpoVT family DNA-binding domain-containing protein [Paenibacillus caui]
MEHQTSKGLIHVVAAAKPIAKGAIRTWGNSLAIRIPSEVIKMTGLGDGVELGFYLSSKGEIVLRRAYPEADDQEGLRSLFLSLRGSSKPNVRSHEEELYEPMGDETI